MADIDDPGGNDPTGTGAKSLEEKVKELTKTNTQRAEELRLQLESIKAQKKAAEAAGEGLRQAFLAKEEARTQLELSEKLLKARTDHIALLQQAGESVDELIKKDAKRYENLEKSLQLQREAVRASEAVGAHTRNIAKFLTQGIGDQWKETFLGGFAVAFSADNMKAHTAYFRSILTGAGGATIAMNTFGSLLMKIGQSSIMLFKEQDDALASFRKTTSTLNEYEDTLIEIERGNKRLAISTGDAGAAFASLLTNVTTFKESKLQEELATTVAQMEKLGVSTELTAKTMEEAMLVLGMTEKAAIDLTRNLSAMATEMNLPIEQVTENFHAAMPVLAKFGRDAPDIFKKVQVASRSLGVEVGQLLQTMGQFDTFEGAASAAGKLNTILGGDLLNSTELLMADEAERLRMVRESIALSGRQFKDMNRFEKLAVANAIGVQDISTATKMLSGNMDRFSDALNASGLDDNEMAERIQKTQTITEKLANTFRMFTISMKSVVDWLHWFVNGIFELERFMGAWFLPTLLFVSGAFATWGMVHLRNTTKEAKKFLGELKKIPAHLAKTAAASELAAKSLGNLGDSMKEAGGKPGQPGSPAETLDAAAKATDDIGEKAQKASPKIGGLTTKIAGAITAAAVLGETFELVSGAMDFIGEKFGNAVQKWIGIIGLIGTVVGVMLKWTAVAALFASGPPGWATLAGIAGVGAAFGTSAWKSANADEPATGDFLAGEMAAGGTVQARHSYLVGEGGTGARPEIFTPGNSGRIKRNEDFRRIPVVEMAGSPAAPAAAQADRDLVVNLFLDGKKLAEGTVKHINKNSRYNLKTAINWV